MSEDEDDLIYTEASSLTLEDRQSIMIWDDYSSWMSAGWLDTSFGTNSLEEFLAKKRPIHLDEFPNGFCPADLRMMIDDLPALKKQIAAARERMEETQSRRRVCVEFNDAMSKFDPNDDYTQADINRAMDGDEETELERL